MKTILIVLAACALIAAAPPPATPETPKVTLVYPGPEGSIFDISCKAWTEVEAKPEWRHETVRRRPEFQQAWDKDGAVLLRTAIEAAGVPFPYSEVQATLTVCSKGSMGMPLLISVRHYLSDSTDPYGSELPLLVFHELMHHYSLKIEASSALRSKYATEPLDVLNHLHVIAFEQFVLKKLGRTDELDKLRDFYFKRARPPYARAWQIVEQETPEAFIAELRPSPEHAHGQ